ncbi:MAG: hypothetical protein HQM11_10370 [SAR324 cluster bacterium]|nr:hypothetical protein [SAR324 cluster bacterium]
MRLTKWLACLTVPALVFAACSTEEDEDDETKAAALADGTYTASAISCSSGQTGSVYELPYYMAFMGNLDGVTHTLTLADGAVSEVIQDADCKLTRTGKVKKNEEPYFQETGEETYTFEPTGCTFSATVNGTSQELDGTTLANDVFENEAEDPEGDIPWEVSTSNSVSSLSYGPVDLTMLGCGAADTITRTLTKQ